MAADESVRPDTTFEKLSKLKPVFDPEGTTTAGNAPGVNDGATCVVVCSEEFARRRGLEPLATILAQAYVADDFAYLAGPPPAPARWRWRRRARQIGDVKAGRDQRGVRVRRAQLDAHAGRDEEIVNVNGGAVALGHPIGASGARLVGTMVHELRAKRRRPRPGGDLLRRRSGDALLIEV